MSKKILAQLEKIFPLVKNLVAPALIFGCCLLAFYLNGSFADATNMTLHSLFYLLGFASFMVLLYFNQSKPAFFIICASLSYVLINFLKYKYQGEYTSSNAYQNLCLLAPLNFAFFYFWPPQKLILRTNVYLLLGILVQYTLAEQLSKYGYNLNLFNTPTASLSGLALLMFIAAVAAAFVRSTASGNILDYSLFVSLLCFAFGFYYAATASGLTVFFTAGILIAAAAIVQNIYAETYKDALTGLASRNSYIIHSKDFPLKYSLGIISIDDYDKLASSFSRRGQNVLTKLIASKIVELEKDESIYRYGDDEFVIMYKNLDKKESFERLETIRRAVASASFVYHPRRKPIKLTVSAAVSEKKRSDANSFEVLIRARKVLAKTRSFSHNVTSQA